MKLLTLTLGIAGLCHAQALSGIHAAVIRNVAIAPDEATFNVQVTGKLESTALQVKAALQEVGAPNPTVIASGLGGRTNEAKSTAQIFYSATFTLPAVSASEVAKGLLNLSSHLPGTLTSMQISVRYAASEARVEAMRQTLLPQLRDEAMQDAQRQAVAAGLKLGPLRSVNDSPSGYYNGVPTAASRIGVFSAVTGIFPGNIVPGSVSFPYTFRLELVFATLP